MTTYAFWIHGNNVEVQDPNSVIEGRFDWGTQYINRSDNENWFHFPIPTPVIIDDVRPPLIRVFVFYNAVTATINEVRVRDGSRLVTAFTNLNLVGDHSSGPEDNINSWKIDPPAGIAFGLGISVAAAIPRHQAIIFTTAGADFQSP